MCHQKPQRSKFAIHGNYITNRSVSSIGCRIFPKIFHSGSHEPFQCLPRHRIPLAQTIRRIRRIAHGSLPPSAPSPKPTYRRGIKAHLQYAKAKSAFGSRRLLGKIKAKRIFPLCYLPMESFKKAKASTHKAAQSQIRPETL